MATEKGELRDMIENLPDEVDPEELIYRLYLKKKIEVAEAAAAAGDVVPREEVVRLSSEWPS